MEAKITKTGRELLCKAHAGDIPLSPITYIALGSGGCQDGIPVEVTGNEIALKAELLKKGITSHQYKEEVAGKTVKVKMQYTVILTEEELADTKISEAGLLDAEGNLIAYLTFLEKGKDQGMEFTFHIDEIF